MAIESGKSILGDALVKGYAIPGFDALNLEFAEAIVAACEELKSPAFLQISSKNFDYCDSAALIAVLNAMGVSSKVPFALHLDHGPEALPLDSLIRYARLGFNSVMVDGSHMALEENIAFVKRAVEQFHPEGISVEGELGQVSRAPDIPREEVIALMTKPEEAERFVEETKVDYLAVSVGSVSGFYRRKVELDLERLEKIHRRVGVPLVFHGGTGIPEEQVRAAIRLGVAKINIAHGLRKAYVDALREGLGGGPDYRDPRPVLLRAKERIREYAEQKIMLLGAAGRARV